MNFREERNGRFQPGTSLRPSFSLYLGLIHPLRRRIVAPQRLRSKVECTPEIPPAVPLQRKNESRLRGLPRKLRFSGVCTAERKRVGPSSPCGLLVNCATLHSGGGDPSALSHSALNGTPVARAGVLSTRSFFNNNRRSPLRHKEAVSRTA